MRMESPGYHAARCLRVVFKQSPYDAEVFFGEVFFLDGFECLHENRKQRVFVCER